MHFRNQLTLIALLLSSMLFSQMSNPLDQAEELGTVSWYRDHDKALLESKQSGKPVLILFQEVPGCSNCRNYGNDVLSNPILVEAIQHEFVPLAIFNNNGGEDKRILDIYGEPTWNNPVVRIVNGEGKDIVNRVAGNYSIQGIAASMYQALLLSGLDAPSYFELFTSNLDQSSLEKRYYQMYCFWSGEASLGSVDGVVSSEPGWMNEAEVVKIIYDSNEVTSKTLDKFGESANCKQVEEHKSYRIDKDPQYYLKQTDYKYLALTAIQKTKINAALGSKMDASKFLSPTQLAVFQDFGEVKKEVLYDLPIEDAWDLMTKYTNGK